MMLELNDTDIISKGSNRWCIAHPYDPSKCVKVLFAKTPEKERIREQKYYKVLDRKGISSPFIAKMFSEVKTNKGIGVEFELVRDYDGQISRTIDHYLTLESRTSKEHAVQCLATLKRFLYKHAIVSRDLSSKNILLRKTAPDVFSPVLVDSLGHGYFIPLCDYIDTYARRILLRVWRRNRKKWWGEYAEVYERLGSEADFHRDLTP